MDKTVFSTLDVFNCRDTFAGDTPLHVAVRTGQLDLVKLLFSLRPDECKQCLLPSGIKGTKMTFKDQSQHYFKCPSLCMKPNFKGQSPFFVAVQCQNEEMLEIFAEFKYEALLQKDYLGENPLFECARNGNENIFNWFTGNNEFFKARGMQNFKG